MSSKLRLGIIGIGNMGSGHAKSVVSGQCPDFELKAVADINPSRLDWAKEALGDIQLFDNAEKMLDSGLIDACIVSVPHYDHPKYAIECMKRGIHVMVEKPAGVYTKQVKEMNEEADKHPDVVFGMMFNQRTNCIYRKMRELVQSGKYGRIRRTNWIITNWYRPQAYYDSGDWRATWSGEGGGVLLNQCPHQLDLWQWICGMPVSLQAHMKFGQWHDIEVEDDVTVYAEYENGSTGVFVTTTGDANGTNRFEIQMDSAKLIAEHGKLTLTEFDMPEPEFSKINKSPFGSLGAHEFEVETDGENPQHVGVLNAWGGAILRGTPLVADGREGINGLTLSNAMHLSAFTGSKVEIPFDDELYYNELMKRVKSSRRKPKTEAVFADTSNTYGGAGGGSQAKEGNYRSRWQVNW
ncbi:MAG: Gfo/Idh/MocA family oxidoreductase [Oscillospiraceae bacterium]|nr:Gfo/Idh/MocA family oxidoreductase [Oscillospiraceae bacterium]